MFHTQDGHGHFFMAIKLWPVLFVAQENKSVEIQTYFQISHQYLALKKMFKVEFC